MNKLNGILCGVFLIWIYVFSIGHILLPDREFSEMENRYLMSTLPKFTADRLFSGKFAENFETYIDEQFPLRDFLKQASTDMNYTAGKRLIGGVYFASSNHLIGQQEEANKMLVERNIQSLLQLRENGTPLYVALIPNAASIWADKLPYGSPELDQSSLIKEVYSGLGEGCIDIYSTLFDHRQEDIYYRTDHHWTSLGAYYGYEAMIRGMGMEPVRLEMYSPTLLSDGFYGTLYSKAPAHWISPDEIYFYAPDMGVKVTAYDGKEYVERALYCMENLEKKDKYTVFLGGNQPQIVIETNMPGKPTLLVLRDSYFDSLVPFLQPHFSQIHLIDVRYYQQDLEQYIRENKIDMVLVACSVDQFVYVMNLATVIK